MTTQTAVLTEAIAQEWLPHVHAQNAHTFEVLTDVLVGEPLSEVEGRHQPTADGRWSCQLPVEEQRRMAITNMSQYLEAIPEKVSKQLRLVAMIRLGSPTSDERLEQEIRKLMCLE